MPAKLTPLFTAASEEAYQGEVFLDDLKQKQHYCVLCDMTVPASQWAAHLQSGKHTDRVTATRDLLRRHFAVRDAARLKVPRIEAMPYIPWQDQVFARFGRVLVNDEADVMAEVDPLLVKLELLEAISLLELAVWKGICCSNCPDTVTGYFGFQKWMNEGWKEKKELYRRSNEVVAIMNSVVPFLNHDFETKKNGPSASVSFPSLV